MVEKHKGWLPPREGGYRAVDEADKKETTYKLFEAGEGTYKLFDEAGKGTYKLLEADEGTYKLFEYGKEKTYKLFDEAGEGTYELFEAGEGTYKIIEYGKERSATKAKPVPPKGGSGVSRPTKIAKE